MNNREHRFGSGFAAFMSVYRYTAKRKNRSFTLSEDEVKEMTSSPCAYCGIAPYAVSKKSGSKGRAYVYNGLDRVDSNLGYTRDNVVPCCWTCGRAKRCLSLKQFRELILLICNHHALDQS